MNALGSRVSPVSPWTMLVSMFIAFCEMIFGDVNGMQYELGLVLIKIGSILTSGLMHVDLGSSSVVLIISGTAPGLFLRKMY